MSSELFERTTGLNVARPDRLQIVLEKTRDKRINDITNARKS